MQWWPVLSRGALAAALVAVTCGIAQCGPATPLHLPVFTRRCALSRMHPLRPQEPSHAGSSRQHRQH